MNSVVLTDRSYSLLLLKIVKNRQIKAYKTWKKFEYDIPDIFLISSQVSLPARLHVCLYECLFFRNFESYSHQNLKQDSYGLQAVKLIFNILPLIESCITAETLLPQLCDIHDKHSIAKVL